MKMKNILFFGLFIYLSGCSDNTDTKELPKEKQEQALKTTNKNTIQEDIYDFDILEKITLEEGNFVKIIKEDNKIKLEYNKSNNQKYYANFSSTGNQITFEKINVVSSVSHNLHYINFSNIYYINNKSKKNKYKININPKQEKEINLDDYSNKFEYNNITKLKILNIENYKIINVDLNNKKNCNKINGIIFEENNINYINEKYNNLKCGVENILISKNNYNFNDKRDFNLFDKKYIIQQKYITLKNDIENKYPIEIYENETDYIIEINDNSKKNISLDYRYSSKSKEMILKINSIPEKWLSVDKISISKDVFFKIAKINIEENKIYNSKKNIKIKKESDSLNFEKILFDNGQKYSFINDLSCNYFNNGIEIKIKDIKGKNDLFFTNNKNKNCQTHPTQKIFLNIFDYKIKTNKKNNISKIISKYLDLERENNSYVINGKNGYNLYNYKTLNNQLYLYVDIEKSKNYYIVNKPIEKIKIKEYNNINVIDLSKDINFKNLIEREYKIYRDYAETMKANIKIRSDKNQKYYSIRFHSILLDKNFKKCDNNQDFFDKTKDGRYSYTYYIKNDSRKKCNFSGVELNIFKVIGDKIDIDFTKSRKVEKLKNIAKVHDKQKYGFKKIIENSFIDFDFDVLYHNNERKFILKFNELNKNSSFNNNLNVEVINNVIQISVTETKDFVNNEKELYITLNANKDISSISIKLTELDGNVKYVNYKLGE